MLKLQCCQSRNVGTKLPLWAGQRTIPVGPGPRLGALFVRTLHRLIHIAHFLALYVDDFLGFQSATVAEMSLCLTLCFCGAFGIPLSWKKLQFGCSIRWIGWDLDFDIGCVSIPSEKLEKLADSISTAGLARVVIMAGLLVVVVEPSMPHVMAHNNNSGVPVIWQVKKLGSRV